jgi:hypothetical protein
MMNWILLVMGLVVAVVVALMLGGMMAPKQRRVVRGIRLPIAPDEAWPVVRQVDGPPRWCASLPNMRVVQEQEAVQLVLDVLDDDNVVTGQWQLAVLPLDESGLIPQGEHRAAVASLLVLAEQTATGNPVVRMVRSVDRSAGRVDTFLEGVALQFGVSERATDVSETIGRLVSASRNSAD